jgi:hypothetical protein
MKFHGVAQGAVSTRVRRNVVGFLLNFFARVLNRDREPCDAHCGWVDNVVSDESCFVCMDAGLGTSGILENPDANGRVLGVKSSIITTVIWPLGRKGTKMQRISSWIWLLDRFLTSMKRSPKFAVLAVVLAALPLTGVSRPTSKRERALCCLCMCHAIDENQCAPACLKMQHGTRIIEEPEMNACTKSCLKQGVRQIVFSEDGTRFEIIPSVSK